MAPGADPAFRQAMDQLMVNVDRNNILAVHRAFQDHADNLQSYLDELSMTMQVGLCGRDPVSYDAARAFTGKISELLRVHWSHWEELTAVAGELRATAVQYGHTEEDIARSLTAQPS